jgi:hypothetical protein
MSTLPPAHLRTSTTARPIDSWPRRWQAFLARQRARWLTEHWRIGFIDAPLSSLLRLRTVPSIRWLTLREPGGYWADPFARSGHPGEVWAERFDEVTGVGRIERMEVQGDALVSLGPVVVDGTKEGVAKDENDALGRGLHASFPHAFELDGQALVVCETGAARECVVWRVADDGRWHSPLTLLRDVAAADPAIFRWQGRLWLAFTDADRGPHDNLCLFHADRLEGPWRPHRGNPVRESLAGARMAGAFFEHEGALYRPGQDCRAGYGAAVVIHRVDACSPEAFSETEVSRLLPDPAGAAPDGLHTLNAWGDRTLVDGKSWHFSSVALKRKLLARFAPASAKAASH